MVSVFDSTNSILLLSFIKCIACAFISGIILAFAYSYKTKASSSFLATLAMLPATCCIVIMMVNGNVGAGVAVAGAFSLVRYRSAPGSAKEILAVFMAMCTGLVSGMGFITYCLLCALIFGMAILASSFICGCGTSDNLKLLHVTIPEELDYTGIFDDLFETYTTKNELVSVKTSSMGSLFKLKYEISLREAGTEKEFIDAIRCRNGNLEVMISRAVKDGDSL